MERNLPLDLIRGVCALGIAAYHWMAWSEGYILRSLGTFGVYTFFVLSALTMMIRYGDEFRDAITLSALRMFYCNRIARILPLLAVVAIAAALYFDPIQHGITVSKVALTASGLFALHMPGLLSMTTGAWSLGIELFFYALFPAICILSRNAGFRTLFGALFVSVAAQQLLLADLPPSTDPEFWGQYTMPLIFAPFFICGLIVFRLPAYRGSLLASFVVLAGIFGFSAVTSVDLFRGGAPYVLLMGLSALTVALAYRADMPAALSSVAWFLGKISYSVYLTHWIAYEVAMRFKGFGFAVYVAAVLMIATFVTYAIEVPADKWLRRSFRRQPPAPVT